MIHFYVLTARGQLAIAQELAKKQSGRITHKGGDIVVTAPRRTTVISLKRWEN